MFNLVRLSHEDFLMAIKNYINPDADTELLSDIYSFIRTYPDQRSVYLVSCPYPYPQETINLFKQYGIYLETSDTLFAGEVDSREYLIFISRADTADIENYCREFVESNLPPGIIPTKYVLDIVFDSLEDLRYWNSKLENIFTGVRTLFSYSNLKLSSHKEAQYKLILEEVESIGYRNVNIDSWGEKLSKDNTYLKTFLQDYEKFLDNEVKKGKCCTVCIRSDYLTLYLAAYAFYTKGISHNLLPENAPVYLNILNRFIYEPDCMLLGDKIDFLQKLPDLAFIPRARCDFTVALNKSSLKGNLSVLIAEVKQKDSVGLSRTIQVDIKDLVVLPITDMFIFEGDLETVKEHHDRFNRLLISFYEETNLWNKNLNLTNICFILHKGSRYMAYIEDLDVSVEGLLIPHNKDLKLVTEIFSTKKLMELYPINIYPGYEPHLKRVLTYLSENGIPIKKLTYETFRLNAMGAIFNHISGDIDLKRAPSGEDTNILLLGLWNSKVKQYRLSIHDKLLPYLNMKHVKNSGGCFTIFGGPIDLLGTSLFFSETSLRSR